MSKKFKVLLPIDLSANSLSAMSMATRLAKENDGELCLVFVAPPALPGEAIYGPEYRVRRIEETREEFEGIEPDDTSVKFVRVFLQGNPGPSIVQATRDADVCVMSTHGRGALLGLLMGSVAQYVLRNAACPVILVKGLTDAGQQPEESTEPKHFVTEIMRHAAPIRKTDSIESVLQQLQAANATAAPVINGLNKCVGILTTTDIERYESLQKRYEAGDKSVVKEMFEVNKYGMFRCGNHNFHQVCRHQSSDVVSVNSMASIQEAADAFEQNPGIHHLVVLDDKNHPVGIIDLASVEQHQQQQENGELRRMSL